MRPSNLGERICRWLGRPTTIHRLRYSNWPTIPQCYIEGEVPLHPFPNSPTPHACQTPVPDDHPALCQFIGGCDIMIEMYQSGELAEMVERAAAS